MPNDPTDDAAGGAPGALPESDALAEASIESLSYYFSKDPLALSDVELSRLVEELRAKRKNWAANEAAGGTKTPRVARGVAPRAASLLSSTDKSLDEMGL